MTRKLIHALAVAVLLASGAAQAQAPATAASPSTDTRSPILGDPGSKPTPRRRPSARTLSRADKQPPGVENGSQPDRAQAGGGSR